MSATPSSPNKGGLCVALVVTRHAREEGIAKVSLNPEFCSLKKSGRVIGLGKEVARAKNS